ncbi:carboxypeptidase regulatory-like domain-containing protein [Mucilaginibacter mali]|uniref:Carboxypeptidase regulatory-like domain-containing protein n=1 Tax=Mucilaginibacter mali TaxID=2740462 RepID=A0A7D4UFH5_9SPHI|nr:carboxypeptidase regulatory-like domain-containing protein [Mucilaginibacter mali]QKJ30416.1 carboxypeptidase regulatory-like domain-containing protein [Mucilaginibacter mali]
MSYKKFLPLFVALICICCSVFAQRDTVSLNTIIAKSVKFVNDYPIEKVYVHFDKPYYAAGDTVWLKAYTTTDLHVPSTLSKIVYVDVYNDQDSLMASIKMPLVNGVAPGMIPLPAEGYKQGNYRLRAYTNWMLNFDGSYLFTKVLTIGNPIDKDVLTTVSFGHTAGAQPGTTVRIFYKDPNGKPLANQKISWRTEASHDETGKGRGTTDANGYLTISLPPTPSITLSSSTLFTTMELGTKNVTNIFPLKSAAPGKDVQFFPEGGQLIAGVPGKVAVKAIKADGLGVNLKGTVVDNAGQTVCTLSADHIGMGAFAMQPEAGKSYKANITFADGTTGSYDLPRVQASGITLMIANADADNLTIRILSSESFFQANQNKNFSIVAQQGGFIKYAAQTRLEKQVYSAIVPKTKFQSGTLQITLFGPTGSPISERMVFIQKADLLNLAINTDKPQYLHRQPVKMTIAAKNGALPAEASLSVSVVDEGKVPVDEDAETTILTSLLLTSDLRGYIEKPNYYFKKPDEKTIADLDILMLTQGYRRFSFRDVMAGRNPKILVMPETGIDITGTLRNRTGLPIFKGIVRLMMADRTASLQATTNADGQFKFANVMVNDSTKITITARDNPGYTNLMLMVDGQTYPAPSRITTLPDERLNIDSAMRPYLENSKRVYNNTHQLKEVVVKAAVAPKRPGHLEHGALTGLSPEPDHLIDGERFKGCTFFVSCLQSMALGLTYVDNIFYVTRDYNAGIKKPMEVYMDGLQVDMNYLQGVVASEVESVEIFFKDGMSGINQRDGTNGVLVINKKKAPKGQKVSLADLQKLLPNPYQVEMVPRGYTVVKEFYAPKYDVAKPNAGGVDLRSTIYWNPKVTTDKITGAATVQFNNADGTGTYRAIVEGMDAAGNIGRYVYRYKVQ